MKPSKLIKKSMINFFNSLDYKKRATTVLCLNKSLMKNPVFDSVEAKCDICGDDVLYSRPPRKTTIRKPQKWCIICAKKELEKNPKSFHPAISEIIKSGFK